MRSKIEKQLTVTPSDGNPGVEEMEDHILMELRKRYEEQMIKMNDFEEIFGKEAIEKDHEKIEKKKRDPDWVPRTKRSELLELILLDSLEENSWFGDEAMTIKASEFDDVFRGTDIIMEFKLDGREGNDTPKLCIDAKSGDYPSENCDKKMKNIISGVLRGKLGEIKYFQSPDPFDNEYKGPIEMIPSVIVGVQNSGLDELIEIKYEQMKEKSGSNIKASEHHYQIFFMEQIKLQLETFIACAKEGECKFKDTDEVVIKQKEILDIINSLLEERRKTIDIPRYATDKYNSSLRDTYDDVVNSLSKDGKVPLKYRG